MVSGLDLKLKRVAKRVKAKHLADAMGVKHPYVSQIEARAIVPDETADRYLTALATFPDVARPLARAEAQTEAAPALRR